MFGFCVVYSSLIKPITIHQVTVLQLTALEMLPLTAPCWKIYIIYFLPLIWVEDCRFPEVMAVFDGHRNCTNRLYSVENVTCCHHIWGMYNMSPLTRSTVKYGMPLDERVSGGKIKKKRNEHKGDWERGRGQFTYSVKSQL